MVGVLINDLLDLAKMENNSFTLTQEYFNLNTIIKESFQILLHMANDNNINLKAEIDTKENLDLIQAIYGDERRYLQILMNFLSNALKFTNWSGTVTIEIKVLDRQPVQDSDSELYLVLQISVIDTGIGISEEGLKKLFVDFGKLQENSKRNR